MPQFSVIVPTHRRREKLQELLDSLERQSLQREYFEVIIVATEGDSAFQLLSERTWNLNLRATFIPNDPERGRSASAKRNFGASLAASPWLAFIDDDCIADKDWLKNAAVIVKNKDVAGIEGYTHIPEPEQRTLTYKGIIRLSQPGGYQTCNMFYRKADFLELGGFDRNFPFYLEDTDVAWTLLEKNRKITYCSEIKVEHPVPRPEPKRLLANALRMRLLPYLAKKHPATYRASSMRAYPRSYIIFLGLDGLLILTLLSWSLAACTLVLGLRLLVTGIYCGRLFYGLHFTWQELAATYYYTLICPLIGFIQLMRGNWENQTTIFLR